MAVRDPLNPLGIKKPVYKETRVDIRRHIADVLANRGYTPPTPRQRQAIKKSQRTITSRDEGYEAADTEYNAPALQPKRTLWERFQDDFTNAASRSIVGAAVRQGFDWLDVDKRPGETEEQHDARIAEAERLRRAAYDKRAAEDPIWAKEDAWTNPESLVKGGTSLLGNVLGGADPTYLIAPGATVAERMAAQAGVQAVNDAVTQGVEVGQGVRHMNELSPLETLTQAGLGAVFQGGAEGAGAVARALRERIRAARAGEPLPEGNELTRPLVSEPEPQATPDIESAPGYSPSVAEAQRARLETYGQPPAEINPRMSEASGAPDQLTFPNGRTADVNVWDTEGLEKALQERNLREPTEASQSAEAAKQLAENRISEDRPLIWDQQADNGNGAFVESFPANEGATTINSLDDRRLLRSVMGSNDPKYLYDVIDSLPAPEKRLPIHNQIAQMAEGKISHLDPEDEFADPLSRLVLPEPTAGKLGPRQGEAGYEMGEGNTTFYSHRPDLPEGTQQLPFEHNDNRVYDEDLAGEPGGGNGGSEPPIGGGGEGGAGEPPNGQDVAARMIEALKGAKKMLPEQRRLYREERARRVAKGRGILESTSGESGYHAQLGAMRGALPKPDFGAIRPQFNEAEINSLFSTVQSHPAINNSFYSLLNAQKGLAKVLDGQMPNASEISLLSRVFGNDFVKETLRNRTKMQKGMYYAANALNLPRTLMATLDLSAPFRQGIFLTGRKEFWGAWKDMFKSFGSERSYNAMMDDIRARPSYDLMEESKLALADPHAHDLSQREEQFVSSWAEKIPVLGRAVRASDRAYSGFLNKVRADVFDDILRKSEAAGIDFNENPKALTDIASFVNNATGRGSLGKLDTAMPVMSGLFFSPRLMASRVNLLNPVYYGQLSPVVRKEAVKSLLSTAAIATTILSLAAAGGADVEADPRSSDFGKIKVGNTRYDILGGFGQYITLGARLLTNETKTKGGEVKTMGKGFGTPTRKDAVETFFENKASPVAGFVRDFLGGKTPAGEPFDAKDEATQMFIPLFLQDTYDVIKENGLSNVGMATPGLFGVGVNTYSDLPPAPTSLKQKGIEIELDKQSRKDYNDMVRAYTDGQIKELKSQGIWDELSKEDQKAATQKLIKAGRENAKKTFFEMPEEGAAPNGGGNPLIPAAKAAPVSSKPEEFTAGVPTSMRRTVEGNRRVGGVDNSGHLSGDAIDFVPSEGVSWAELVAEAKRFFPGAKIIHEKPGYRNGAYHGEHVHVQQEGLGAPYFGKKGSS